MCASEVVVEGPCPRMGRLSHVEHCFLLKTSPAAQKELSRVAVLLGRG